MGNYKIRMSVGIYDESNPSGDMDLSFDTEMSEDDSVNIDKVEKTFLALGRQVLKNGMSAYLEEASKKNAKNSRRKAEEEYS